MNKKTQDLAQWETYADLYNKGKGLTGDDLHNNFDPQSK